MLDFSVDFEKYIIDKYGENFYNESSDGDYDYFGGNIWKRVEEDIYYYVFFLSNEDEVDYGVKNFNEGNLIENLYDYMNIGVYKIIMLDN